MNGRSMAVADRRDAMRAFRNNPTGAFLQAYWDSILASVAPRNLASGYASALGISVRRYRTTAFRQVEQQRDNPLLAYSIEELQRGYWEFSRAIDPNAPVYMAHIWAELERRGHNVFIQTARPHVPLPPVVPVDDPEVIGTIPPAYESARESFAKASFARHSKRVNGSELYPGQNVRNHQPGTCLAEVPPRHAHLGVWQ